ncbi:ATP-binding protein [Paenibacillus sinopodophylli]|uniref:ATP-binding protein n=1 Tax=Paenibacillus sinopodophylli TaxID=1837342 RepID=UPI001FED1211|nr:ATP-binding protein [Paenibacillus sinopodophylli]
MTNTKNKIKGSHICYLLLFIGLLVAVRWMWHDYLSIANPPTVKQGVLDLREVELEQIGSLPMDGDWLFFPGQWAGRSNVSEAVLGRELHVPGNWNTGIDSQEDRAYGYGTYYVRILLDRPLTKPLSIWFQSIYTAAEVEINGKLLAQSGAIDDEREKHVSKTEAFVVTYMPNGQSELEIFVRVSNYESPLKGGIVRSVQFGLQEEVNKKHLFSIGFQIITCVILLLHALYALIIYLMNIRKKGFIVFFLVMMLATITIAVYHDGLLFMLIDTEFEWMVKLKALSYMWFSYFLLLMGRGLVGSPRKGVFFYTYFYVLISYSLFISDGPLEQVLYSIEKDLYMILYYIPLFWTAYYFMRMVFNREEGALFLVFSVVCVINNILWGSVYYAGTTQFMYYPVEMIAAITSFSAHWFKRYFHHSNENVLLNVQLTEANRMKDRFIANTSHELRTPLHGIMNIAQSVLRKEKNVLNEQSQRDMELLVMVSRRMSLMLNDLLDVVRLQDKRVTLQKTSVQVQSLGTGVLDMLRFLTENKQVELRMYIEKDLPNVYADEGRLVQILMNLVHNAIKYTQEGSIELGAIQVEGEILISVRDTGVGMDEAMQKRAFEPYEQAIFGGGGIGLGLSICKELVELHQSKLIIQSQLGKGSEFSFKLAMVDKTIESNLTQPIISSDYDSDTIASAAMNFIAGTGAMVAVDQERGEFDHLDMLSTSNEPVRVLAVDDEPVNLKVLHHILSMESYQIETAASANEALIKLNTDQFDLVIADVMMPGTSGYELTRLIRERFTLYELPVILLTARSEPEDIYAGFLAGANDYVTKPVDALELKYRAWSLSSLKHAVNDRLRMEAAYLQAQINPHFLFNTLNSIFALGDMDTDKMRELADAFTSYLRISFNFLAAGKLVPLSRELELVKNYLYIEQQRFEERLLVEWEMNADADILIPPLTIQPLVENAVRHGLLSQSKGGTLRIRIEQDMGIIHVSVSDDGIGMDELQLSKILSPVGKEKKGIGLLNTHSRLVRLYGAGLSIKSKPGEGTTVSFSVNRMK